MRTSRRPRRRTCCRSATAPALAPHAAAQNGLPDNVVSIAPALEPRVGGAALGVPQVNAPVSEGAAKASPYYFTDGSLQGWQATPQDIVVPSNGLASPEAFGLPGDDAARTARRASRRAGVACVGRRRAALLHRRCARSRAARPAVSRRASAVRRERDPPRFPDPAGARERQAARVVRQCSDDPQAAGRDRPSRVFLCARELEHSPRRACIGRPCDGRVRACAGKRCSASSAPRRPTRSCSCAARPRRST